jgi:hypothetical protein
MPSPPGPFPRFWRRNLQFSMRGLIALVLVIGASLGWLVRSARIQREAVSAIERAGGHVLYEWEWKDLGPISGGKPVWSPWLVAWLGADYFGNVSYVHFNHHHQASNVDAAYLQGLTGLEQLYLCDTAVNDTGLVYLSDLTRLQFLNLRRTNLGDAGLGHLKRLTRLRSLLLGGTRVTDAGLEHVKGLTSLEVLDLDLTDITDAGLEHLKGSAAQNLKQLHVAGTRASDAGVDELQRALPKLEIIR